MPANEHSIRVSAKGEFGQLERGLKNLQKDLGGVVGEIDKGARRGGIFDKSQLRALDIYRDRFKGTIGDINREFEKQNEIIEKLHKRKEGAYRSEREDIQKQINLREKELDVIRKQLLEMERLYSKRNKEAGGYSVNEDAPAPGGGGGFGGFGGRGANGRSIIGALSGVGGLLFGMAGIGGLTALASKAYTNAYQAEVAPLDLSQRIRGQAGWTGSANDMWGQSYHAGTRDRMGYNAMETWQFMDSYTSQAGSITDDELSGLLKFGRAYGVGSQQLSSLMGTMRGELGGSTSATEFAGMVSSSVGQSGMTPRIVEVMETSNQLLKSINTTLEDTGARQVLAYQTTLDRIGVENNMMKLTGAQGADIISGMEGIFQTGDTPWKWMGIRALQQYDPGKYGDMGLYGLERSFEDGLLNEDNLSAMTQYIKSSSGGNEQLTKRMVQQWLQQGGYDATKTQVDQLWDVTDGFEAFNEKNMEHVMSTLSSGDQTEDLYGERVDQMGQSLLDIDARFERALEEVGKPILGLVTDIKEHATQGLEWLASQDDHLSKILATAGIIAGGMFLGTQLLSGIGALLKWIPLGITDMLTSPLALAIGAVIGTYLLSLASRNRQEQTKENIRERYKERWGIEGKEFDDLMQKHDVSWAELQVGVANPKVARLTEELNRGLPGHDINKAIEDRRLQDYLDDTKDASNEADAVENWLNSGNATRAGADAGDVDLANLGIGSLENLSVEGIGSLEELTANSLKGLDDFFKDSSGIFDDLFDTGELNFGEMLDTTNTSFNQFITDSNKHFNDFLSDHSSFTGNVEDMIYSFLDKLEFNLDSYGGGGYAGEWWNGWDNRITSKFGYRTHPVTGRRTMHSGLDIDGEQGERIGAVAGGKIVNIKMDDGGRYDPDGKMNSTMGGTSVVVQMPNGSKYSYSHLDDVNPALLRAFQENGSATVNTGDWLGNIGGDRGMPGSGYSTTGSHLHMGYYDANGVPRDPEAWLRNLSLDTKDVGDFNYQSMVGGGTSPTKRVEVHNTIDVNLSLNGDGADALNSATEDQLRALLERILRENQELQLSLNPTTVAGW